MKTKEFYICEHCGYMSFNEDEMDEHEAAHYGLTFDDYEYWEFLKREVERASYGVNVTKNVNTDAALDKAIEELLEFEKEHNLTEVQQ